MRLIAMVLAATLFAPSSGLEFAEPEAEEHFDQAQEAFAQQDYVRASEELGAAHSIEPLPRLLYARAQAERLQENWSTAAELYTDFIETGPPEQGRVIAERHRHFVQAQADLSEGRCDEADAGLRAYVTQYPNADNTADAQAAIGTCTPPEPEAVSPEPEPAAPPPPVLVSAPPVSDDPDPPRRWYRDPLGGAFVGVGLAGIGAGTALLLNADYYVRLAEAEGLHSDVQQRLDTARTRQTIGIVALSVGGALIAGALVRYAIVARQERTSVRQATASRRRSAARRRRHQLSQRRP